MTTKTSRTSNQQEKILKHLSKRRLSLTEARSRYAVQNLSAQICHLRNAGFDIYTLSRKVTGKPTVYGLN